MLSSARGLHHRGISDTSVSGGRHFDSGTRWRGRRRYERSSSGTGWEAATVITRRTVGQRATSSSRGIISSTVSTILLGWEQGSERRDQVKKDPNEKSPLGGAAAVGRNSAGEGVIGTSEGFQGFGGRAQTKCRYHSGITSSSLCGRDRGDKTAKVS